MPFWSTTARALLFLCLAAPAFADDAPLTLAYVTRDGDPLYQERRAYAGLRLAEAAPGLPGAELAVRDTRAQARAAGRAFALKALALKAGENAAAGLARIREETGAGVVLLDTPREDLDAILAGDTAGLLLFNVRLGDDDLRGERCAANLFHTVPSRSMLTDGLAQHLYNRNWRRALVLEGAGAADKALAAAFQRSARKFGVKVTDVRPFVLSNDPRRRDQTNVTLLTAGGDYDVIFIADTAGEFGRYVPYQTASPRPVVGTEGLEAAAWHWTWERYGAPQLNHRFERAAGRLMDDTAWAAWAAVKAVVAAAATVPEASPDALRAALTADGMSLDVYKGTVGSFRRWNNQLRQPILLHTHNAVIERTPLDGALHQKTNLDTLGEDEPETACRVRAR